MRLRRGALCLIGVRRTPDLVTENLECHLCLKNAARLLKAGLDDAWRAALNLAQASGLCPFYPV